jgi:uncharacterized protein DUF4398
MNRNRSLVLLIALGALGACASTSNVPHETMASSEGSIRAAEEVGAAQVPTAALHLQYAREQTETAQKMIRAGHNERAKYMLMRAQADAELAITLSKEDAAKNDAEQTMEQVRALQSGKTVIP